MYQSLKSLFVVLQKHYYVLTTPKIRRLFGLFCFAMLYYAVTEFTEAKFMKDYVAFIWPAAGLGFAGVYLWGYWLGISIWMAEFNLFLEEFELSQAMVATGNMVAIMLSVWVVKRLVGSAGFLNRISSILIFIFAGAVLCSVISATNGIIALELYDFNTWWTWGLADMVGILVIAPLIITWFQYDIRWYQPPWAEWVGLFGGTCLVAYMVFAQDLDAEIRAYPLTFLLMPFATWAAFRFGQRETMWIIFIVSLIAVYGTMMERGPFALERSDNDSIYESLLLMQAFIAVICVSSLFLTAVISERNQLDVSMARFVPHEFLSFLGKKSIIEVQLGDHVQKEMTVLFSDIRGFTSLSESMTPQENFNFINAYLSRMEPHITTHRGFIDKYIGDAIMALFPYNIDDALQCSIAMLRSLNEYNKTRGRPGRPVLRIGVGIHTGMLMLGTVGGKHRMDSTVIADAVNLAARTESLTKVYGISLLVTEQTYRALNNPEQYRVRVIDRVVVKGKTNAVMMYEVFDGDVPEMQRLKIQTCQDFTAGVNHYHRNEFETAQSHFHKVLAVNINDVAAKLYIERCQQKLTMEENEEFFN